MLTFFQVKADVDLKNAESLETSHFSPQTADRGLTLVMSTQNVDLKL